MNNYKISSEYKSNCLATIYQNIVCEILEDKGEELVIKGQFKTGRVMPKKTIKTVHKSKLKFIY